MSRTKAHPDWRRYCNVLYTLFLKEMHSSTTLKCWLLFLQSICTTVIARASCCGQVSDPTPGSRNSAVSHCAWGTDASDCLLVVCPPVDKPLMPASPSLIADLYATSQLSMSLGSLCSGSVVVVIVEKSRGTPAQRFRLPLIQPRLQWRVITPLSSMMRKVDIVSGHCLSTLPIHCYGRIHGLSSCALHPKM